MQDNDIKQLIERQRDRHSLTREFYSDPDIYERDIERIFLRSWLYAGHQSEIPAPGDWLLFDFAGESVIVARSQEGGVNAMLNVCRHRGSRICVENTGCSKRLICRYHGWTYDLDGRLVGASRMNEDFDKSGIALKRIHVEVLDGMIFVNFADKPSPFQPVRDGLADCLRPYDLGNARVAHRQNYPIAANWKLAVENYCECYHCGPAHPEYSRGHSLAHHGVRSGPCSTR
jgi:Rieske 2Fe-2S family protein